MDMLERDIEKYLAAEVRKRSGAAARRTSSRRRRCAAERDIEKYLAAQVRKRGGEAYKFTSPAMRGVSDRLVVMPGAVWFVELKRPGGKLTPLQERFRDRMLQLEQRHVVLRSKEDVDRWLKCL